jgi:hypothetical protein
MRKGLICFVAVIGLVAALPALAETEAQADCTDANMMNANASIEKMKAGDNKTAAMKEMEQAKSERSRAAAEKCKTHLNKAIDLSKGAK